MLNHRFWAAYAQTPVDELSVIELSEEEVAAVSEKFRSNKATGRESIPARLLKELAHEIAPSSINFL